MDYDGANRRFLTNGQWTVLTPRFAPNQQTITFMTYQDERPRVMVYQLDSGQTRPLVTGPYMTFAPRYSPDSRYIIFSMAVNGNTDVYRIPVGGGTPQRLTKRRASIPAVPLPAVPHRLRRDRGGNQQLYVMNADGPASAGSASAGAAMRRRCGARAATSSPSPAPAASGSAS